VIKLHGKLEEEIRELGESLGETAGTLRKVVLITLSDEYQPIVETAGVTTLEAVGLMEVAKRLFLATQHKVGESTDDDAS
jgi:hypothetical protein